MVGARELFFLQHVQTGSWADPAYCVMGDGDPFPESKAAGRETNPKAI